VIATLYDKEGAALNGGGGYDSKGAAMNGGVAKKNEGATVNGSVFPKIRRKYDTQKHRGNTRCMEEIRGNTHRNYKIHRENTMSEEIRQWNYDTRKYTKQILCEGVVLSTTGRSICVRVYTISIFIHTYVYIQRRGYCEWRRCGG